MMNKIISFFLCILLAIGCVTTVSADDTATDALADNDTYSVDMKWGTMFFVYSQGYEGVWNPYTHEYTYQPVNEGWIISNDANYITVTNNSAFAVQIDFDFATAEEYSSYFTGEFSTSTIILDTSVSHTVRLVPDGTLPEEIPQGTAIGQISVKISISQ